MSPSHNIVSGIRFISPDRYSIVYIQLLRIQFAASKTYSFTFRCQRLVSRMSVIVNSPPTKGHLSTVAFSGFEISTLFNFVASIWIDVHLPLEYQSINLVILVMGTI